MLLKSLSRARYSKFTSSLRKCSTTNEGDPREQMIYDVVIVGGGPAGLSTAIRLKQLSAKANKDISVCLIDKGSEIGSHIISGNVFEPRSLNELFPEWKTMEGIPLETEAKTDNFFYLQEKSHISIPQILIPKQLHNHGNYIISLSALCRWLAVQAESLGVEIYPGFAADEVLYSENKKAVIGVATKDVGISKNNIKKDTYTRGIELLGKQTIFAEGCRGSCSEEIIERYKLREGKDIQSYGLGIKEVWSILPEKANPGYIQHTVGWPIQHDTFGGTFLYHQGPNLVHLGMVVGLDYKNPYLNPYQEFQRWKTHPLISSLLDGGECISYGARALNEGGYHAIPKLTFPGGLLIGCSAGFLNAVKIKGSHTAMKSGMIAADTIITRWNSQSEQQQQRHQQQQQQQQEGEKEDKLLSQQELIEYENNINNSWIMTELKEVRNTHAAFKYGLFPGMVHTAVSCFITKGSEPWTLHNTITDSQKTLPMKACTPITYPKPDGKITFDLLTNLQRSGTNHEHDQPSHLKIKPSCSHIPLEQSLPIYGGPEQRFCPAGVYEYIPDPNDESKTILNINAQNCVHCKTCSIKTPGEYIKWTVPEGGGGPSYTIM